MTDRIFPRPRVAVAPLPQGGFGREASAKAMTSKADPPRERRAQTCRCERDDEWNGGEGRCGYCGKELRS